MWRKVLREYFAFPKKERQGILVLFVIWFTLIIYKYYSTENYRIADWHIRFKTDSLIDVSERNSESKIVSENYSSESNFKKLSKPIVESNYSELKRLGISSRTSAIIMKFVKAGASLKTTESLNKIYGINDDEKKILIDNFLLEENVIKEKEKNNVKIFNVDINTCDSSELESLPMIGPALSSRIIKYRTKLGGFISKDQLLEVYALDTNILKVVESKISLDIRSIKKIKINEVKFEELSKFPYLNYKLARVIINYREQHGNYKSKEDLLKIHLMNHKIIDKLEPYIDYTDEH